MSSTSRPSRLPEYLAGLYALLIVYASLESFSAWMTPLPGTPFFLFAPWPPRFTRSDVAINLLAYAPLGFFVALAGRRTTPVRLTAATATGLLLSFAMETVQMFIPTRDASAMDLVCNSAGAGIGGLAALAFDRAGLRASISAWRRRVFVDGRGADLGLALLAIWLLAQLNPGIPLFAATFVLSNIVSNVPAVMLLLPGAEHPLAGLTLALVSTLAGNLFIVGSIANIIVVDAASRRGVDIAWRTHARVGIPVTLATLAITAGYLALRMGTST